MPNHHIHLPDQKYYRLEEIAKAIEGFPPQAGIKKGIDCISRKLIPNDFWIKKSDYSHRIKGLVGSLPLRDIDREELNRLLPQLPDITNDMSDKDIDDFFNEYYKIQNRPHWVPDIQTPSDRQKKQNAYDKRITEHCQNFISRVQAGHYHLFDSEFNVLRGSSLHLLFARKHALVSREDAEKYFKHLEIDFPISQKLKSKKESELRWTPENVNEMREYRSHSTAKKTAAHFNISTSRMNKVFKENPPIENTHLEASKPNKNNKKASHSNMNALGAWSKQFNK